MCNLCNFHCMRFRPVLVIEGSGRLANFISDGYRTGSTNDWMANAALQTRNIHVFESDNNGVSDATNLNALMRLFFAVKNENLKVWQSGNEEQYVDVESSNGNKSLDTSATEAKDNGAGEEERSFTPTVGGQHSEAEEEQEEGNNDNDEDDL